MAQQTVIFPVSPSTLDNLYSKRIRHYSSDFFEEVTNTVEFSFLQKRAEQERRQLLGKIKKMKILINRFYIGQEKDIMLLLAHSASPVSDISNLTGLFLNDVYRKINYLRRISVEFYKYFSRNTYKEADLLLRKLLTSNMYAVFHIVVICRNIYWVGRMLSKRKNTVLKTIECIENILDRESKKSGAIRDVYVAWKRINMIRKTYYGSGKNLVIKDLEKFEGEKDYEYTIR